MSVDWVAHSEKAKKMATKPSTWKREDALEAARRRDAQQAEAESLGEVRRTVVVSNGLDVGVTEYLDGLNVAGLFPKLALGGSIRYDPDGTTHSNGLISAPASSPGSLLATPSRVSSRTPNMNTNNNRVLDLSPIQINAGLSLPHSNGDDSHSLDTPSPRMRVSPLPLTGLDSSLSSTPHKGHASSQNTSQSTSSQIQGDLSSNKVQSSSSSSSTFSTALTTTTSTSSSSSSSSSSTSNSTLSSSATTLSTSESQAQRSLIMFPPSSSSSSQLPMTESTLTYLSMLAQCTAKAAVATTAAIGGTISVSSRGSHIDGGRDDDSSEALFATTPSTSSLDGDSRPSRPSGSVTLLSGSSAGSSAAATIKRMRESMGLDAKNTIEEDDGKITLKDTDLSALGSYKIDRFGAIVISHNNNNNNSNSNSNSTSHGNHHNHPPPQSPLVGPDGIRKDILADESKLSREGRLRDRDAARELKWMEMLNQLQVYTTSKKDQLKKRVRKGIPSSLRGAVWPLIVGIADRRKGKEGYYKSLLEKKPAPKDEIQIRKDLPRLFQDHIRFKSPEPGSRTVLCSGQAALYRVLTAYAVHDPEVGYVQGMDSMAGNALLYLDEESTFWFLECLLNKPAYNLRSLYTESMPLAMKYMTVHTRLVEKFLPRIHQALQNKCVSSLSYAFRWYTLRFSHFCPEFAFRVLDSYLFEGDKVLYRVALALLKVNAQLILTVPEEELPDVFGKLERNYDWQRDHCDEIMRTAYEMSFPSSVIREYSDDFDRARSATSKSKSPNG